MVEGGMQNIYVATGDLNLTVQQISSKIVFASYAKKIKGSGVSKDAAVDNLISHISASDRQVADFLDEGTRKRSQYYEIIVKLL